jgi:hypothetical protein
MEDFLDSFPQSKIKTKFSEFLKEKMKKDFNGSSS